MYVGNRKRGLRRLAGAHRVSGLRGLRGMQRVVIGDAGGALVNGKFYSRAQLRGIVASRLGQIDYGSGGSFYDEQTGYSFPGAGSIASSGGGLTPAETSLISTGIATTGALVNRALTPTPYSSYNALTGQYTAVGGAALPSGLSSSALSSSLTSYLPLILLAGGAVLLVSLMKR